MTKSKRDKNKIKFAMSKGVQDALDLLDSAICITDSCGVELWVNQCFEEYYHVKKEEIIGYSVYDLEASGIYNPSLAKKIIEEHTEHNIIHTNKEGKELMTSGKMVFDEDGELMGVISNAVDITKLVSLENQLQEVKLKLQSLDQSNTAQRYGIIAKDRSMTAIIELIQEIARINATVLITGESGTGKSMMAKYIHNVGERSKESFIAVNCSAIPETLFESELFGYESGAFTGSSQSGKVGLFEAADGGTLFLDEIGEMPLKLQVKLLRVLQEKTIQRVGGIEEIPVDVRVIAASNKELQDLVLEGLFREDLFYRLNVIPIQIPPLRERPEDILLMIMDFLKKANETYNKNKVLASGTIAALLKYDWPGNVRELENIINRMVITSKHSTISPDQLPSYMHDSISVAVDMAIDRNMNLNEAMRMCEERILNDALMKYKSSKKMAEALGIDQSTVLRKLKKHHLKIK